MAVLVELGGGDASGDVCCKINRACAYAGDGVLSVLTLNAECGGAGGAWWH